MKELKISIITPTLNQADFIEDTILSVLNQNYKNFEHIVIDGGSCDKTLEILKKYKHLKWISERDTGQSNAINKGLKLASGDIIAWINSDDYYESNIFEKVARYFEKYELCKFLYGDITYIDKNKNLLYKISGETLSYDHLLAKPDLVRQPSSFWRREVLEEIGFLDENLHLVMDFDYFLRIGKKYDFYYLSENISYYRCYDETKTLSLKKKQVSELFAVIRKNVKFMSPLSYKYLLGKYLDSLDDSNAVKRMLSHLRKHN